MRARALSTSMAITIFARSTFGPQACPACDLMMRDDEPIQIITVPGAHVAFATQYVHLQCIADAVAGLIEEEDDVDALAPLLRCRS